MRTSYNFQLCSLPLNRVMLFRVCSLGHSENALHNVNYVASSVFAKGDKKVEEKAKKVTCYTQKSKKGFTNIYIEVPTDNGVIKVEVEPKFLNRKQRAFLVYLINKE